jgi:hypothetical protein
LIGQSLEYQLEPGKLTAVPVPGYLLFYVAALFRVFGSSADVALRGNAFLIALVPLLAFMLAQPAFGVETTTLAAFSADA